MLGNFLGDLVHRREIPALDPIVQRGIHLHRAIDRFTDDHPIIRAAVRRIRPEHHKYAPVVVDIWYDFLLARHWQSVCPDESFPAFKRRAYALLNASFHQIPPRLHPRIRSMVAGDWLSTYATPLGMSDVFLRLEKRVSRPDHLHATMRTLDRELPHLDQEFPRFWTDLTVFVASR